MSCEIQNNERINIRQALSSDTGITDFEQTARSRPLTGVTLR